MNITWELLAERLRNEVQDYGALLHLFEEQQTCVFERDAERLLQLVEAIKDATETAEATRHEREQCVSAFAIECSQAPNATLRALLPHLEPQVRPLIEALIAEVNRLIHRVRHIARQNHLLLSRTIELQQGVIRQICPGAFTETYSARGRVAMVGNAPAAAYNAAG